MSIYYNGPEITATDEREVVWQYFGHDPRFLMYGDEELEHIDGRNWEIMLEEVRAACRDDGEWLPVQNAYLEHSLNFVPELPLTVADVDYLRRSCADDFVDYVGQYVEVQEQRGRYWRDGNELLLNGDPTDWDTSEDGTAFADVDVILWDTYHGSMPHPFSAALDKAYYSFVRSTLWVRVGSPAHDAAQVIVHSVSDHLILDESAHGEADMEAWDRCVTDWLHYDVRRDLEGEYDDDTLDKLTDTEALFYACRWLDYFSGFSGEHSPDMADVVREHSAEILAHMSEVAQ